MILTSASSLKLTFLEFSWFSTVSSCQDEREIGFSTVLIDLSEVEL